MSDLFLTMLRQMGILLRIRNTRKKIKTRGSVTVLPVQAIRLMSRQVELATAQNLGHVGYAIPTELFPPFVSSAVDVVRSMTTER